MKKLLFETENRSSLLVFAISEFILIILGILVALEIDNWNEFRKDRKSELKYLQALHDVFSSNLAELENVMIVNELNAEKAFELSKFTGLHETELTAKEVDSLLIFLNPEVQYRPGSGVLDEIISSGKLELISNDQLRIELSSWESVMLFVRFQEQEHFNIRNNFLEMLFKKGNIRMLILDTSPGELNEISQSSFPNNNVLLLQSLEFENHLIAFAFSARALNNEYYSRLMGKIKTVLSLIENELK